MERDTKFGYGYTLIGIGLAYLLERLFGASAAFALAVGMTAVGAVFLFAGHKHGKSISAKQLTIVGLVFCAVFGGILIYRHYESHDESKAVTGPASSGSDSKSVANSQPSSQSPPPAPPITKAAKKSGIKKAEPPRGINIVDSPESTAEGNVVADGGTIQTHDSPGAKVNRNVVLPDGANVEAITRAPNSIAVGINTGEIKQFNTPPSRALSQQQIDELGVVAASLPADQGIRVTAVNDSDSTKYAHEIFVALKAKCEHVLYENALSWGDRPTPQGVWVLILKEDAQAAPSASKIAQILNNDGKLKFGINTQVKSTEVNIVVGTNE
jgi:hypothetical protein